MAILIKMMLESSGHEIKEVQAPSEVEQKAIREKMASDSTELDEAELHLHVT